MFYSFFQNKKDSYLPYFHKKSAFLQVQLGRGMIEMLGVLALIGLLSVVALVMYSKLLVKNEANELYEDIQRRTLVVWDKADLTMYAVDEEILLPEFTDNVHEVSVYRVDETVNDGAAFVVEISNLTREACIELLHKPFNTPYLLQVGDREFNPENPDYSVCDVFEEAAVTLFVSSAWAAEVRPKVVIPYPPTGGSNGKLPEDGEDDNQKEKCEKEGRVWIENGINGPECCDEGYEGVGIIGSDKRFCCPVGYQAYMTEGESGTSYQCCDGTPYSNFFGIWECCSSNAGLNVVSIVNGTGKFCCPVGYQAYMTEGESGTSYQCCDGTPYYNFLGTWDCCSSDDGLNVVSIVNGTGKFCCPIGYTAYTRTDDGIKTVNCCEGKPYLDDQGQYTCCSLTHHDIKVEGKCCVKEFSNVVAVQGLQDDNDISLCCTHDEKEAYYDGESYYCCDGHVYQPEDHLECCPTRVDIDGIQSSFLPKTAYGAPNGQEACCLAHDDVEAYWDGKQANCCIGQIYLENTSKNTYGCCPSELNENNILMQYQIPVKVQGSSEGLSICCDKRFYGNTPTAYMKENQAICCQGEVYQSDSQSYACCVDSDFVQREVTDVMGAPTGMQTCCDVEEGYNASAYWDEGQVRCCAPKETIFKTLEKQYGCCLNQAEYLDVIGFPGQQYCCEEGEYPYWNGMGYGCHAVRSEIVLIEGYPNTDYEVPTEA